MGDQPKSTLFQRISAAKPGEKRYAIRDDIIPGLFLRVFPAGRAASPSTAWRAGADATSPSATPTP